MSPSPGPRHQLFRTIPVTAWSRARRTGRRRGPTWGRSLEAWRKRDRPSGRLPPLHREKLLSPRPGGERLREDPAVGRFPRGQGWGAGVRTRRGRTGCFGPTRASGLNAGSSFAPPRSVRCPQLPLPHHPPPRPSPSPGSSSSPLSPPPARLPLPLRLSALGLSCHHRVVLPRFPFPTQPALRPSFPRHCSPFSRAIYIIYLSVFNFLPGGFLPPTRARSGAGAPRGGPGRARRRWAAACPSVPDSEVAARLDFCGGAGRGRGVKARRGGDVWDAQPWDGNAAQTDRQTHTHRRAHTPNPKARTTPKRTHFASMTQRN